MKLFSGILLLIVFYCLQQGICKIPKDFVLYLCICNSYTDSRSVCWRHPLQRCWITVYEFNNFRCKDMNTTTARTRTRTRIRTRTLTMTEKRHVCWLVYLVYDLFKILFSVHTTLLSVLNPFVHPSSNPFCCVNKAHSKRGKNTGRNKRICVTFHCWPINNKCIYLECSAFSALMIYAIVECVAGFRHGKDTLSWLITFAWIHGTPLSTDTYHYRSIVVCADKLWFIN